MDTDAHPSHHRCGPRLRANHSLYGRCHSLGRMAETLVEVREVTEQLHPEPARSCRNAITMTSVMLDEIRLRAHARPLDEGGSLNPAT
jgi:hypothetical protein